MKLLVLLYADDTVVFGTDKKEFQNNLDMFYEYSELWHLSINFDKIKIMIFGTRQDQRFNFNLGGHKIDICTDFKYLGVIFFRNRHFYQTKKHIVEQARKAMHVLFKRIRNLDIPMICNCIYLTMLFYQLHYMVVKYGALKIAKLLKIYIMISLDRLLT